MFFSNMNLLAGTLSYVDFFVHGVEPEVCCFSANITIVPSDFHFFWNHFITNEGNVI